MPKAEQLGDQDGEVRKERKNTETADKGEDRKEGEDSKKKQREETRTGSKRDTTGESRVPERSGAAADLVLTSPRRRGGGVARHSDRR